MLFLWLLSVIFSTISTVSGALDQTCIDEKCSCCINKKCAAGLHPNSCTEGCIDGHRGNICYELCQYRNCKSCGGNTLSDVCEACYDGYYLGSNRDCASQCPSNCKTCTSRTVCTTCMYGFYDKNGSTTCKYANCPTNCECDAQGNCDYCKRGYYDSSTSCKKQCPANCHACESDNYCTECKSKYYNGYKFDNKTNLQLNNCTYACRESCTQCQSYNNCSQCIKGKYGITCQNDCSVGCKDNACLIDFGHCKCTSNFLGDKCTECVNGQHGLFCNQTCPIYCQQHMCDRKSGECIGGCISENITGTTCSTCIEGMYGELCTMICALHCLNKRCQRYSGDCEGCEGNFNGRMCDQCVHGKYGENCEQTCPANCAGNICGRKTGICHDCKGNFQGKTCEECRSGYHGRTCDEQCSIFCANSTCYKDSGKCINGCIQGYSGNRCCVMSTNCVECYNNTECKSCVAGFFTNSCNETCPIDCDGSCDISTGECIFFKAGQTDESVQLAGPVAGGVAALVVVAAGVITLVFFLRRRRLQKNSRNEDSDSGVLPSKHSSERIQPGKERHEYANTKDTGAEEAELEDVVIDETNDDMLDVEPGYYNCNAVNMNIKVVDLFSYVTKDNFDNFKKEFKDLPKPGDLSILCKVAKKPENIASNRYNGIYPFDHSRVTIPGEPKFFINACYINGYSRSNAYIASFGPTGKTTKNFTTFWRMVWHEKSDIIVMLTNLCESSGMKCELYWPEEGETCYGNVKVTCRSIEEFAEYTVRCFTISKGKEQRTVTQMHFTAWPDKGVPSEVTSIVEFRQRVKAAPVVLNGPFIVHCSAGVGRTGTYIALDILSEQGKAEGSVNIFNCVSEMRGQRVNMVQTAEQYIFLHKALVHTLTFEPDALPAEELQSLAFDVDSTFSKMFQTLRQEVDIEKDEEIAAREENKRKYADKSRRHSDIPGNRGRVRLFLRRISGNHDYINAVFINSFKNKNLFIAAQTPQSNTVEDFLCMIYQQNSSCVVSMDNMLHMSKKYDVGIYLPADNETYKFGEFIVTSSKCENKPLYTIRKLAIKHTDKGEEKIAYHFQYTKWGDGRKVADSPGDFVQFIKDVEKYIKQREADMPNVVVHCLNGYERSGLFCVVYTLLEKLEAERQVSVVNVIRIVRTQRKLSISSVEQLKFCFQCVSAYLESFNTYSNFAV